MTVIGLAVAGLFTVAGIASLFMFDVIRLPMLSSVQKIARQQPAIPPPPRLTMPPRLKRQKLYYQRRIRYLQQQHLATIALLLDMQRIQSRQEGLR